ncbi:hypothetical protein Tco_0754188 [Tanacetum coccineum]
MASFNQRHCFHCKDPLEEHERCQRSTCKRCWPDLSKGFCHICNEYSSIDDSNPNSFIDSPKVFNPPLQPLTHSIESLNANPNFDNTPQEQSSHYQDPVKILEVQELLNKLLQDLQSINEELAEFINTPSWNFPTSSYDDDDDEYSFATQQYLMTCSTAITPDLPKMDSLIMEDEHLDTIPETESDEFIKSSV